jgi:hypothetical protein
VTQFFRVGSHVMVFGRVDIDPTTAALDTTLGMSLPVASNFATFENAGGVAAGSIDVSVTYAIQADDTNNRLTFQGEPASNANRSIFFSCAYQVI